MGDFFTIDLLIDLIASFFGSAAFAVVFKVNKRHVLFGAINGLTTYLVYYTVFYFLESAFAAALLSTAVAALCAELLARKRRAPSSVFLIPGVIPTVPGSNLYFFMRNLLEENMTEAFSQLGIALGVALGIACGTVTVSITWGIISDRIAKRKERVKGQGV